jgi:hypothetical protein
VIDVDTWRKRKHQYATKKGRLWPRRRSRSVTARASGRRRVLIKVPIAVDRGISGRK